MLIDAVGALIRTAVTSAFGPGHGGIDVAVRRSERGADLQCDVAMVLARTLGGPPRPTAEAIAGALPGNDVIERVDIKGAGFIEVTVRDGWLAAAAERIRVDPRLGVPHAEPRERVVIDYSAPNVAKEMHVGHVRSTVIGDALARVLAWRGHDVVRQNHLGDWGTPIGMLMEHLADLGGERGELADLGAFYRAARAKFDASEAFAERARQRVVLLQRGDAQTLAWWQLFIALTMERIAEVYARLGVTLRPEHVRAESSYNDELAGLLDELEAGGFAVTSEGAACVFPEGFTNRDGEPLPLIVRKREGGFGYAATDLATIRHRIRALHATRLVYVVGAPQRQHLAMIFRAAEQAGWLREPVRATHVAFGSVLGSDRKMLRSRAGDTARLVDLIDEALARSRVVIEEHVERARAAGRAPELQPDGYAEAARVLAIGSLKYADLSCDYKKDYVFDWARMIQFSGDTAGGIQYARRALPRHLPQGRRVVARPCAHRAADRARARARARALRRGRRAGRAHARAAPPVRLSVHDHRGICRPLQQGRRSSTPTRSCGHRGWRSSTRQRASWRAGSSCSASRCSSGCSRARKDVKSTMVRRCLCCDA